MVMLFVGPFTEVRLRLISLDLGFFMAKQSVVTINFTMLFAFTVKRFYLSSFAIRRNTNADFVC